MKEAKEKQTPDKYIKTEEFMSIIHRPKVHGWSKDIVCIHVCQFLHLQTKHCSIVSLVNSVKSKTSSFKEKQRKRKNKEPAIQL